MTAAPENRFVLPGDLLGAAEEYLPGPGTYEDGGRIFAALLGHTRLDPKSRTIAVSAIHSIPHVGEGDVVYARVDEVKSAMAVCTVLSAGDNRRTVPGAPEGTVHISKAKDGFTDSLADEFSVVDIPLAKVLQAQPTIKLTTAPPALGVVSARCQVCHGLLDVSGRELLCPRCGHREHRKLAREYGHIPTARDAGPHAPHG
jgi:exosome complex component CSL4